MSLARAMIVAAVLAFVVTIALGQCAALGKNIEEAAYRID